MKITLWIYWNTMFGESSISVYERDLSQAYHSEYIFLYTEEVEIQAIVKPDDDFLRGKMVDNLQAKKSAIQAESHMKIKAIDEQIQQLLCIENKEPA